MESGWDEWEVGSESDTESESSDGWIDVSSDEEKDVYISDSDGEGEAQVDPNSKEALPIIPKASTVATSKVNPWSSCGLYLGLTT